jgi:hypothetical protein
MQYSCPNIQHLNDSARFTLNLRLTPDASDHIEPTMPASAVVTKSGERTVKDTSFNPVSLS